MSSDEPKSAPLPLADTEPFSAELGQTAFRGFALIAASTVGVKTFALLGQVVVARILTPKDFGMVALAYSVLAFTGVFEKDGLREILVQRGQQFAYYANAAFWMSLLTGLLVLGVTLAASPFAVQLYRAPHLSGVLMLLALSITLLSLQSVPGAQLQKDLRFKTLALVGVVESVILNVLTVLLAIFGAGMYSLAIPTLTVRGASLIWQWRLSHFVPTFTLDWARWRDLSGASLLMFGSSALLAINFGGASMMLGIFHDITTVGIFSFSYSLSTQLTSLMANNLLTVLLPAFSRLQKAPLHQMTAFLRVVRTANLVGMPICFLLAALADPLLRLLYGYKWTGAIPVVQIVSLGMAFNIGFSLSHHLLMAQGRYLSLFWFNVWRFLGFMLLVGGGAWWGGAVAVGAATTLFAMIYGPAMMYLAIRPAGGTWRDVVSVHLMPFVISASACGVAAGIAAVMPSITALKWLHLVFVPILCMLIGLPLSRWLMRPTWDELADQLRQLARAWYSRHVA